jgi:hypothetical protein
MSSVYLSDNAIISGGPYPPTVRFDVIAGPNIAAYRCSSSAIVEPMAELHQTTVDDFPQTEADDTPAKTIDKHASPPFRNKIDGLDEENNKEENKIDGLDEENNKEENKIDGLDEENNKEEKKVDTSSQELVLNIFPRAKCEVPNLFELGKLCDITFVARGGAKVAFSKWALWRCGSKTLQTIITCEPTLQELDVLDMDKEAVEIVLRGIDNYEALTIGVHVNSPLSLGEMSDLADIDSLADMNVIGWIIQAHHLAHRWELTIVEQILGGILTFSTCRMSYPILAALRSLHNIDYYQRALQRFATQEWADEDTDVAESQTVIRDLLKLVKDGITKISSKVTNAIGVSVEGMGARKNWSNGYTNEIKSTLAKALKPEYLDLFSK